MRFLSSLQTKGGEPATAATAVARATGNASGYFSSRTATYAGGMGNWDITQAVVRGYERVIMVYRCIDAIAHAVSSLELIFREDDDKVGRRVQDEQLAYVLNRRSNIYETAQQFRYRLSSQLLLSRKGAFVERVNNAAGRPAALHLLDPANVTPIKDPMTFVSGYEVRGSDTHTYELKPQQVVWIRVKPHPVDPYSQMTPLVAAGLSIDTDYLSRLFNRNFVANDGRPGMLIAIQGQLNPDDAEEVKSRFNGGPATAGQTTVIEADGLDIKDMAITPHDLQFLEGLGNSKLDIQLAFGTPESVLGNASGRTYDNADAERLNWYMDTVQPHGDAVGAGLDILTIGGLTDNIFVAHNWESVDVLQRASQQRADRARQEWDDGLLTADQYLMATGRRPWNVPGTQVLWIKPGAIPVGRDDATTQAAQQLQPVPAAPTAQPVMGYPQTGSNGSSGSDNAYSASDYGQYLNGDQGQQQLEAAWAFTQSIERKVAALESKLTDRSESVIDAEVIEEETKTVDLRNDNPDHAAHLVVEAEMIGALSVWSRRQGIVVNERMDGVKARKGTQHWEGDGYGTKALDGSYITDPMRWAGDIRNDFEPILRRVAEKELRKTTRKMAGDGTLTRYLATGAGNTMADTHTGKLFGDKAGGPDWMLDDAIGQVLDIVERSALRQSDRLAGKINALDSQGAPLSDIKKTVTKMVGSRSDWKRSLATYATTAIVEGTVGGVFDKLGPLIDKKWNTMDDEKVRHSHRVADGQTVPGNTPFMVGGFPLRWPCDPLAPIDETANCRCWSSYAPRLEP